MFHYLGKRLMHALPILLIVNALTFVLFFMINSPEDMARMHFGYRHLDPEAMQQWLNMHGYDLPLFYNAALPF